MLGSRSDAVKLRAHRRRHVPHRDRRREEDADSGDAGGAAGRNRRHQLDGDAADRQDRDRTAAIRPGAPQQTIGAGSRWSETPSPRSNSRPPARARPLRRAGDRSADEPEAPGPRRRRRDAIERRWTPPAPHASATSIRSLTMMRVADPRAMSTRSDTRSTSLAVSRSRSLT